MRLAQSLVLFFMYINIYSNDKYFLADLTEKIISTDSALVLFNYLYTINQVYDLM